MPQTPDLWKITVTCEPKLADAIASLLEPEALAVSTLTPPREPQALVEAITGKRPSRGMLGTLHGKFGLLTALYGAKAPDLRLEKIRNLDWLKKVAADFPPLAIGHWTIYGGAHKDKVKECRLKLQIDASSAFGTGEHPTTRGCLMMLDRLLKKERPRKALDIGCGSGILAMAFTQRTHGYAVATDLDPVAVAIAHANVRRNGLQPHVRVALAGGYAASAVRHDAPYDLVMANIFARPLCLLAKDCKRHLKTGGIAILSGILCHQANAVLAAHHAVGLTLVRRMNLGAWTVLALKRRA